MTERLEGSGTSQLVQLIQQIGYNKDIDIELATVTSAPPNIKIKVDNMKVELDSDDLIVAESLTKHTRTVTISGGGESGTASGTITEYTHSHTIDENSHNHTGDSGGTTSTESHTHTESSDTHTHTITGVTISGGTLTFDNELKVGEIVIVASINDGQTYVILDRAVIMTNGT